MAGERVVTPRLVVGLLLVVVVTPLLPLLVSGRWGWWEAWVYAGLSIGGFVVSRWLAARRHPDLLRERGRMLRHDDTVSWDRLLSPLVGLGSGLIPLAAGLNMRLAPGVVFGWPVKATALLLFVGGYALGTLALMANRFFSGVVRLQPEREHRVVTDGPYAWVRHPGYAGALLAYWTTPLWLDAPWAFVASALLTVALVARTALEDGWLKENLAGYAAYAERVRYRLVWGVW